MDRRKQILFVLLVIAAGTAWGQPAPTVTQQPTNQTVYAGSNATFTVAVSGTGPFTYQWQHNGTNLPDNIIYTVAGGGTVYPGDGGAATNAELKSVVDVAVDASGDFFVVDVLSNRIHKVSSLGLMSAAAGTGGNGFNGDGKAATNADLSHPYGVAVDSAGNLFITDNGNNRIREVGTNGIIHTIAGNGSASYGGDGGPATNASLDLLFSGYASRGVVLDTNGNLFIADTANNRIREVGTNGVITTVAGKGGQSFSGDGGPATNAYLASPTALAMDGNGNLFIADTINRRIREIDTNGIINTVAGGGTGDLGGAATNDDLLEPYGVTVDAGGNVFISYFTTPGGLDQSLAGFVDQVWTNGIITKFAGRGTYTPINNYGDGGPATNASLGSLGGLAVNASDELFISDTSDGFVREVVITGPALTLNTLTTNNAGTYDVVVSSPYGSVTSAVATVSVLAPVQNLSASWSAGPGVQLQFTGAPGYPYLLQVTTNLALPVSWQPLVTNVADSNGNWSFTDTNTNNPAQFYRALFTAP